MLNGDLNSTGSPMKKKHSSITKMLVAQNLNADICTQLLQPCPTLCNLLDCSPSDSSVHGILQARILELVAMPFSKGSSHPRDQICVSCIVDRFFTTKPTGKPKWRWYHSNGRKGRGTKDCLLKKVKGESLNAGIKLNIQKNSDHGIWSHHFMANKRR